MDLSLIDRVLCSDRVTQMTKTYNDIEAVTRLLEELKRKMDGGEIVIVKKVKKERDLELAAKIGQTLLEKNKYFEEKNEELELLISQANERISQLKHDLSMKDELLKIYTQTYEGGDASSPDTPSSSGAAPGLEKKIRNLEEENLQLHLETSKLKGLTEGLEEKEQQLVNDCVQQLEDVHSQLAQISGEMLEKSEECATQKEEITNLLHQIVTLQKKVRTLTAENMDLQKTLEAAYDSQNYLTREIADLKEKNEELLAYLEETQEELRRFRSKERPSVMRHSYMSPMFNTTGESLASELENSLRSEVDYPKGYASMERKKHAWKVFETAKAAKSAGRHVSGSSCATSMLGTSLFDDDSRSVSQRSSLYFSDTESAVNESCSGDIESLYGASSTRLGKPGIPGSSDLQTALRRLSMRRANELNEMDYARDERERQEREDRLRERTVSEISERSDTESQTPGRCRTPDSMFSANSGYMSMTGSSGNPYYKMPEKLRIVKPLEGSATLRQWQRLATPHLGGIFENRPGVRMKVENKVDASTEAEVYTLSDYEEDDELVDYHNRFQESSGVYTLTDSRVKHPSEAGSDVDTDSVTTVVEEEMTSSLTSSTPRMAVGQLSENYGTSTYSMSLGLASLLNERDTQQDGQQGLLTHHNNVSSNPPQFPSLISDTHFSTGHQSSPSTTLTLPTNSYKLIPSPSTLPQTSERSIGTVGTGSWEGISSTSRSQRSVGSLCSSQGQRSSSDAKSAESANLDANMLGVINKLKNTGFSLYGYLTGDVPADGSRPDVSRPNSLPLSSTTASTTVTVASAINSVTMVTGSTTTVTTGSVDIDSMVTIATPTTRSPKKSNLASVLTRKTAGGVIGALTKWHRDGSL